MARIRGSAAAVTPWRHWPSSAMDAAKSASDRAQRSGNWAWRSWSAGLNHSTVTRAMACCAASTDARRIAVRAGSSVAGSALWSSTGTRIRGYSRAGWCSQSCTQDGHVVLPGEPRRHRAVTQHLEVGERALRCRSRASPGCARRIQASSSVTGVPRRSGGARTVAACSHWGSTADSSMVPPSTPTTPRTRSGIAGGELHDHVAAPGLADHDGRLDVHLVDDPEQVVGERPEVIAVIRLAGTTMPSLVDGDARVPEPGELLTHAIPHPRVGRQAVDQQERGPAQVVEPRGNALRATALGDRHAQAGDRSRHRPPRRRSALPPLDRILILACPAAVPVPTHPIRSGRRDPARRVR